MLHDLAKSSELIVAEMEEEFGVGNEKLELFSPLKKITSFNRR